MTSLPNSHIITNREMLVELIATPFRAIGEKIVQMTTRNTCVVAIEKLNAMSDADLAAKGLTRADAVRQILGIHF